MGKFLSERMVEMIIQSNPMECYTVEGKILQGSLVSPILVGMYNPELVISVEEYMSEAEGLSFLDDLHWETTTSDVDHVILKLERCAAQSIKWSSR